MAITDAPITTYSDTTPQKRVISDVVSIIDPMDTPVVKYFGLEGDPSKFRLVNFPGTKIEWLTDDYAALTDSLATTCGSTVTTFAVSDGTKFKKGHVLEVDTEEMWVSSVSTNTLTVTRGYGSTTKATHAKSATVTIVSMARLEGASSDDDYKTDVLAPYNYSQIFHAGIKVARSQNIISQYGIAREFDYQAAKKVPELTRLIESTFFTGKRNSGSATAPRSMGGIEAFATVSTASKGGAALDREDIESRVQDIWERGGTPDLIICHGWVKRKISGLYESSVRTERDDDHGGVIINFVDTEFGTLKVLMSRWCPKTKLYICSSEHIGFVAIDPFFQEPLSKDGDYERGQVVGEYSLVIRHPGAHSYISSISTTS